MVSTPTGPLDASTNLDSEEWTTNPNIPVVAVRARHLTREQWMERAITLAWKHKYVESLVYLGTDASGVHLYMVSSRSARGTIHRIRMDFPRRSVSCDCIAAQYGYPCGHIGAAWMVLNHMVQSVGPSDLPSYPSDAVWNATMEVLDEAYQNAQPTVVMTPASNQ